MSSFSTESENRITVRRLDREQLLRPGLDVETATDLLSATSIPLREELVFSAAGVSSVTKYTSPNC